METRLVAVNKTELHSIDWREVGRDTRQLLLYILKKY